MKKYIRAAAAALIAVNIFTAAAPKLYAAPESGSTDTVQQEGAVDGTQEEIDPYQKELENTYKEKVQTNELDGWAEGPGIYGDAGIVMDAETGAVLYGKNIDKKEYPASITKILTALLALEYAEMTDEVQITAESLTCLGSGYASIGMKEGNVITMEQALYAMLLASSNEVAYAVAETVAKGQGEDYQWFLDQMNQKARDLGGSNSNFVNANGVQDEQHYTCAKDMALIACELFEYPEFLQICQTASYTIPASSTTEEHIFQQKHEMLLEGNSEYYNYAVAGKTGYTTEANNTLVTLADNGEMKLVCVTLPENVKFSDLDSEISRMKNGEEGLLSYTYQDNPVGEAVVKLSGDKAFKDISGEEKIEESKTPVWQLLLICFLIIIVLLAVWLVIAAQRRSRRRRRRRRRNRRGR